MNYLIVFVGERLGGVFRHGFNVLSLHLFGSGFPFGTLAVNVLGCFIMGVFAGWFAFKGDVPQAWRLFLMTGILGGYTTFSAFSLDAALLWERGEVLLAAGYVLASVALSIGGLFFGLYVIRSFP